MLMYISQSFLRTVRENFLLSLNNRRFFCGQMNRVSNVQSGKHVFLIKRNEYQGNVSFIHKTPIVYMTTLND